MEEICAYYQVYYIYERYTPSKSGNLAVELRADYQPSGGSKALLICNGDPEGVTTLGTNR